MALYKEDMVDIEMNTGVIHRSFLTRTIGEGDKLANRFGVNAYRNGAAENLGGSCTGHFIRADGGTVAVTGVVSGNTAYVELPQACYAVEGQFTLAIKVTAGDTTSTLRIVDGVVSNTDTGTAVDPGTIVDSIDDLIDDIEAAVASIPSDYSGLWNSVAQPFSSSREGGYAVGEYCAYDGTVYICTTPHTGTWNAGHFAATDLGTNMYEGRDKTDRTAKRLRNSLADTSSGANLSSMYTSGGYIDLSAAAGETVNVGSVTSSNSYSYIVVPCSANDRFGFSGRAGTMPSWAFLDSSYKMVEKAKGSTVYSDEILLCRQDGFFVSNIANAYTKCLIHYTDGYLYDCMKDSLLTEKTFSTDDFATGHIDGQTGANVAGSGTRYRSSGYISADAKVIYCPDLYMFSLYCYDRADTYVGTWSGTAPVKTSDIVWFSGYTPVKNATDSYRCRIVVAHRAMSSQEITILNNFRYYDEKIIRNIGDTNAAYTLEDITDMTYKKAIKTNVSVGDTVNTTPYDSTFDSQVIPCSQYDEFVVTGRGGDDPRLWAFVDSSSKLISKSANAANETDLLLVAPADGSLIVNANSQYTRSVKKKTYYTVIGKINDLISTQEDYKQKKADNIPRVPLVKFDLAGIALPDMTAYAETVNFSSATFMEDIYTLFDGLVTAYPELVTKYDGALYDGLSMSYPAYANGVASGNATYQQTPAYKTYMYKISDSNIGAGNERYCVKKKLFVVSGIHGNERLAVFDSYVLAHKICTMSDPNMFSLLAAFDIYILPCVNGYGIYHDSRTNADGVNINRNFPTRGWQLSGSGTADYTGPTAGSTFEAQLIMALTGKIGPDVAVDCHNYGVSSSRQFYTVVSDINLIYLVYQALASCSNAFIKGMPQYFGTKYQLFVEDSATTYSPRAMSSTTNPTCNRWFYEHGIRSSATIEVCNCIRYQDGELANSAIDQYGTNTMSIAWYTLTALLLRYCGYELERIE